MTMVFFVAIRIPCPWLIDILINKSKNGRNFVLSLPLIYFSHPFIIIIHFAIFDTLQPRTIKQKCCRGRYHKGRKFRLYCIDVAFNLSKIHSQIRVIFYDYKQAIIFFLGFSEKSLLPNKVDGILTLQKKNRPKLRCPILCLADIFFCRN